MAKTRRKETAGRSPDSPLATMTERPQTADYREAAPQSAGDTSVASPDRERIAMRAYELYLARGASDGAALDDWLTAEHEITSSLADRDRDLE